MSKAGSASKVKINSFDDLFGASQAPAGTEQVREIPQEARVRAGRAFHHADVRAGLQR